MEYKVKHRGEYFWIVTNDNAQNFKLVKAPIAHPGISHWVEVVPHRPTVKVNTVYVFRNHLVLSERESGLKRYRIMSFDNFDK
jgi:oligopeptidase B